MKNKNNIFISKTKQSLFSFALVLAGLSASSQTYTVAFTGSMQTITLPQSGTWQIECWGADGGNVTAGPGGGGKGGYSIGELNVLNPGTQLNVFVGGKGFDGTGSTAVAGAGGWNGGGGGAAVGRSGGGGGGATDVRVGGTAATDRVIVAGGGGGAAYYSVSPFVAYGGNGGGIIAQNGDIVTSAGVLTTGGGGAGANGANPGLATVGTANGSATGGGGGGSSAGSSIGQPGVGGGAGGYAGPSSSGATGSAGGGGGGYAGGAGGVQTSNAGVAGGGGSAYLGGVSNGTTALFLQPGYVTNPDINGNGYALITYKCDVSVQASKNPICVGEQISLSTNAGSGIQWSHGPTTPTVFVSPATNTSYTLVGVSSTTTGCSGTVVITVTVNPLPAVSAVAFPTTVCQGGTGTLTSSGALTYTWNPGNTSGNIVTNTPLVSSIYTVTGESVHGCVNTATVAMNVNPNQLTLSSDTSVCVGTPAYLTASGAVYYNWSVGAPFNSITVYPTATTIYSVSATDANNCPLYGFVTVTLKPLPTVNASASQTLICKGEDLQVFASGALNYVWSNGATGGTITPSTEIDLPMYLTVTGTDNNGCSSTASITVIVSACTSLEEEKLTTFKLMPNPSSSYVTIETEKEVAWKIYDLSGQVVLEGKMPAGSQSLDVSTLPNGVYLVRLQSGDSERSARLIKN